jgi:hypothetical protein
VTRSALGLYASLADLPASALALFDGPGAAQLFTSRPWFESFAEAAMPAGAAPLFCVLEDANGAARAILPCRRLPSGRDAPGRHRAEPAVAGLTSFYSCDFRPIAAPDSGGDAAFALGRGFARAFAAEPVVRFDSLDSTQPTLEPFLAGLRRPGRALLRYAHFGRWREDVRGRDWNAYLAARGGALRETIRRKGAKLTRAGATMEIVAAADIARGVADYETVYAASWKEPEPFPAFQPVLMRRLAEAGWLRLALCRIEGRPVAAQIWARVGPVATVLKLAHDQAFDAWSPGTVLTAFAIRHILAEGGAEGGVGTLDFGRGDDPYKAQWTSTRTQHVGVLWTSLSRRPALIARHTLGRMLRPRTAG